VTILLPFGWVQSFVSPVSIISLHLLLFAAFFCSFFHRRNWYSLHSLGICQFLPSTIKHEIASATRTSRTSTITNLKLKISLFSRSSNESLKKKLSIHICIPLLLMLTKEKKQGRRFFFNILISSAFFIIIYYSGVFIRCFWYLYSDPKDFSCFASTIFLLAILDDKLSYPFLDHHY
jgi:hypothetical protein